MILIPKRSSSSSSKRMLYWWVGILMIMMMMMMMMMMKASMGEIGVPALFVFGDSLVDVGNNNYLPFSVTKANFPHNGIDFLTHKPNGRFSNGKNAADFLAEKLGLPSSPPYLSIMHENNSNFLTGINFASGGAGIFDTTNQHYGNIAMNKQIQHMANIKQMIVEKVGQESSEKIISKAVFLIVVGSNDILGRFVGPPFTQFEQLTPRQLVHSSLLTIKHQLKRIYDIGARKFAVFGVGAVGCCPTERKKNKTEACNEEANYWASKYDQGLVVILQQYKDLLHDFQYTFVDTYNVLLNILQHPSYYGFKEVKAACCGLGDLKARIPCLPVASYCGNRSDHVFWDLFHPTEATARIIMGIAFDGPLHYAFPMNIRQLAST